MMPTKKQLTSFLWALNRYPIGYLRRHGIKDDAWTNDTTVSRCARCPVAIAIQRRYGLGPDAVWVGSGRVVCDGYYVTIPPNVQEAIRSIDATITTGGLL